MNKEELTEKIKQHKKRIAIVLIVLLLISCGSIYALFNNANSTTPKNAKQSELKKDGDKLSDDKKNEAIVPDKKANDDITTSSDIEDTKKDTISNSTSRSDNDDKKSSNDSSSVDKPSNGGSSSSNNNTSKPNTPIHEHSWIEQFKTVHHDEIKTLTKEAWTEYVPIMDFVEREICNVCQRDITGEDMKSHVKQYHPGNTGGWHSEWKEVQVGTDTINHPAEYSTTPAWVEKVSTGFKCSGCGKTK